LCAAAAPGPERLRADGRGRLPDRAAGHARRAYAAAADAAGGRGGAGGAPGHGIRARGVDLRTRRCGRTRPMDRRDRDLVPDVATLVAPVGALTTRPAKRAPRRRGRSLPSRAAPARAGSTPRNPRRTPGSTRRRHPRAARPARRNRGRSHGRTTPAAPRRGLRAGGPPGRVVLGSTIDRGSGGGEGFGPDHPPGEVRNEQHHDIEEPLVEAGQQDGERQHTHVSSGCRGGVGSRSSLARRWDIGQMQERSKWPYHRTAWRDRSWGRAGAGCQPTTTRRYVSCPGARTGSRRVRNVQPEERMEWRGASRYGFTLVGFSVAALAAFRMQAVPESVTSDPAIRPALPIEASADTPTIRESAAPRQDTLAAEGDSAAAAVAEAIAARSVPEARPLAAELETRALRAPDESTRADDEATSTRAASASEPEGR